MQPGVMAGDAFAGLVGLWGSRSPERFERAIFDVPPTSKWAGRKIPWMKRLAGLPGERVQLSENRLFINGREVKALDLHNRAWINVARVEYNGMRSAYDP